MKITVKRDNIEENPFYTPNIVESDKSIVLITDTNGDSQYFSGSLLKNKTNLQDVHYSTQWRKDNFKQFKGRIILTV